jgi:exodeoxyribonuclease III
MGLGCKCLIFRSLRCQKKAAPFSQRIRTHLITMKIATWNVNSLNVRLPHVLDWIEQHRPDALCLQEIKMETGAFPHDAFKALGYGAVCDGQKTYNGVAILSPHPLEDVVYGIPGFDDPQKRFISASILGVRVASAYFPNGQSLESDKFVYKLRWLEALTAHLKSALCVTDDVPPPAWVLTGDFNIAPQPADVHPGWKAEIHVSKPERAAFSGLLDVGMVDAFRLRESGEGLYSWWDYRQGAFQRDRGLRIDHILVSNAMKALCQACYIDKAPRALARPSDHTPVVLELDWAKTG